MKNTEILPTFRPYRRKPKPKKLTVEEQYSRAVMRTQQPHLGLGVPNGSGMGDLQREMIDAYRVNQA